MKKKYFWCFQEDFLEVHINVKMKDESLNDTWNSQVSNTEVSASAGVSSQHQIAQSGRDSNINCFVAITLTYVCTRGFTLTSQMSAQGGLLIARLSAIFFSYKSDQLLVQTPYSHLIKVIIFLNRCENVKQC